MNACAKGFAREVAIFRISSKRLLWTLNGTLRSLVSALLGIYALRPIRRERSEPYAFRATGNVGFEGRAQTPFFASDE